MGGGTGGEGIVHRRRDRARTPRSVSNCRAAGVEWLRYEGSEPALTPEQRNTLGSELDVRLYTKAETVCAFVQRMFKVSYTAHAMAKVLKRPGFVYRMPKCVPAKANEDVRRQFVAEVLAPLMARANDDTPLYFVDGTHPSYTAHAARSRVRQDVPPTAPIPDDSTVLRKPAVHGEVTSLTQLKREVELLARPHCQVVPLTKASRLSVVPRFISRLICPCSKPTTIGVRSPGRQAISYSSRTAPPSTSQCTAAPRAGSIT